MFKRCLCVGLAVILCAAQPWGVAKAAEATEIETAEVEAVEVETAEAVVVESVTAEAEVTEEAVAEEVAVETEALALSEMTLVTADTYYADNGAYPFTVKVQYGEDYQMLGEQFTVSVWDKEVCLADQQSIGSCVEDGGVWFFEDIFEATGEYTRTVVVYKDGTEVHRQDVVVNVSDEHCSVHRYKIMSTSDKWVEVNSVMAFGNSVEPVGMELLDKEGNSVLIMDNFYLSNYGTQTDYRYEETALWGDIWADRTDILAYTQTDRYLKEGMYDAKIIFADDSVEIAKDVLFVTDSPFVESVGRSVEYNRDANSEFVYLNVNGTVDFDRIMPVIYDGDTALTEMVEWKPLDNLQTAIYKLRKLEDITDRDVTVKIVSEDSYDVIINEPEGFNLGFDANPDMYYAEHMFRTNNVKVRFSNVPDNTVIPMNLKNDSGVVLATGQAVVKGGVATVAFMNAEGKPFDFTSEEYRYYDVEANIQIGDIATVDTKQIYNRDYIDNDSYAFELPRSIMDHASKFIKDFHITEVFYLAEDLFEEDTVLKANLYSQDGAFLKELPVSKTYKPDFTDIGTETVAAWFVSVDLLTMQPEIGKTYKLELYTDEQSYGISEMTCFDDKVSYAMISSAAYDAKNHSVNVEVFGYWPNVSDDKWSIRFEDAQGNTICEEPAKVTWKYSEIEGLETMADATFVVDDSEAVDLVTSYVDSYFTLLYDGQEIMNFNGYNEREHRVEREPGVSVYSLDKYTENYINANEILGVGFDDGSISKVLIYCPYETAPVAVINVPADADGEYYFTAKDIQKLSYNRKNAVYEYYVVDGDGKTRYVSEKFLGLKAVLADVGGEEDNAWPYTFVKYVVENGLMTGTGVSQDGNTNFAPNLTLTREQFAQVLYNAEGNPAVTYSEKFSDVPAGKWYTDAVLWAAEQGIVSGVGGGKFGTGAEITREQLATMIYNYAGMKGYDVVARADLSGFADSSQISSWAMEQIQWANANGIINGKGKNLDPVGKATRAECATMITNYMKKFEE